MVMPQFLLFAHALLQQVKTDEAISEYQSGYITTDPRFPDIRDGFRPDRSQLAAIPAVSAWAGFLPVIPLQSVSDFLIQCIHTTARSKFHSSGGRQSPQQQTAGHRLPSVPNSPSARPGSSGAQSISISAMFGRRRQSGTAWPDPGTVRARGAIFGKMTNRNQTDTNEMATTETKYQTNF